MDLGLENKVAVVMASTSGLGYAVAESLLAEGAKVAISGREPAKLHACLDSLASASGGNVMGEPLDVTNGDALKAHLVRVKEHWGAVDILVTNSGGPPTGTAAEVTMDDLNKGFELTLKSAVIAITTVLPWMREQQWGRIIAMTSSSVREPIDNLIMSNTMRAGLTGYVKSLSREVARDGVLVNSICTGMFMTGRLRELFQLRAEKSGRSVEDEKAAMEAEIPVGRIGVPSEFGAMVAFMASEKASFLNGVAMAYDGGASRHLL